jgi:hypothetical protein
MPKAPYDVTVENYHLRSTFFANMLRRGGYFDLFMRVRALSSIEGSGLNWSQRMSWNISETAWSILEENAIPPMLVFMHPKILKLHPPFLRYYRSVAMLPQKGLKAITGLSNIERIETGKVEPGTMPSETIDILVRSINDVLSLVVPMVSNLSENEIQGMMYATAGTYIDGSWRNSIGAEGERVIRTILLKELIRCNEVSSFIDRGSKAWAIADTDTTTMLDNTDDIRVVNLINGFSLLFSSEPDISIYDDSGNIVGVIEVKAGLDPAGALERLGGMLKSFENTLAEYPDAITILIASCITDEMESRIGASMLISQKYTTAHITSSDSNQRKFANRIRKILKLT